MKLASVEAIVGALHGADVRYLITGGLAVGTHGYLRSTHDVDLVARRVAENLERLFGALRDLGYRLGGPVAAEQFADPAAWQQRIERNEATMLEFQSDRHPETPVNVFAAEPFCFEDEYERALVKLLHGAIPVRFVCIDTLIRMKEASGRPADLADGEQLRLTLKAGEPLDLRPGKIDCRLTTWEGSRREQLRHWAGLPVENAIAALEEMEEIVERFRVVRATRAFHTASTPSSPARHPASASKPYGRNTERRLRDLKIAPADTEIETRKPVERMAKMSPAPALSGEPPNGDEQ